MVLGGDSKETIGSSEETLDELPTDGCIVLSIEAAGAWVDGKSADSISPPWLFIWQWQEEEPQQAMEPDCMPSAMGQAWAVRGANGETAPNRTKPKVSAIL